MKLGRKRLFETPEQLWDLYIEYIEECKNNVDQIATNSGKIVELNKPLIPTIGMFAIHCDVTTDCLEDYEKSKGYEDFFGTIKKIKNHIKYYKMKSLVNGQGSTTGLIFDLKVNYGMIDKNVTELQGIPEWSFEIVKSGQKED